MSSEENSSEEFASWRYTPTLVDLSERDDEIPHLTEPGTSALISEIHLVNPDLLLTPTIANTPGTTVRPEYQSIVDEDVTIIFFTATGGDFDTFERSLRRDHTITEQTLVAAEDTYRVYRGRIAPDTLAVTPVTTKLDIWQVDVKSTDGGWLFRLRIPTRDALMRFRDHCREMDIKFHVRRLYTHSAGEEPFVGLTETQLSTLQTAFDTGYFDIPRGISQAALADMLGISTSALSQRLRSALSQLIDETIADE